jgi:tRNA G37 N-methylase TrmD
MANSVKAFESHLYDVVNKLRALSRGLGLVAANELYKTLSFYQDLVVDHGDYTQIANVDMMKAMSEGEALISTYHDLIREWRREGVIS